MRVTVAIPTFNRANSLAATLENVASLKLPQGMACQILVVDNASSDRTPEITAKASTKSPIPIRHVIEPQQGLSFARNRALTETTDDHVVFFDDDVHVSPLWLSGYAEAVTRHGADCVVGPVFPVFPDPLPPYATPYVLSLIGSDYSRRGDVAHILSEQAAHEVPGCNFGFRRSVALEVGGFDTSLGRSGGALLSGEDSEFGILLTKKRTQVVYQPQCWIEHLIDPQKLTPSNLRRRADGLGNGAARLRVKHGAVRGAGDWALATRRVIGLSMRWGKRRLSGTSAEAFEWELRTRRHLQDLLASVEAAVRRYQ